MKKVLRGAAVVFAASLMVVPTASAERVKPNIHFFSSQQSDAHWTPKDSADANRMSIELEVGPLASGPAFAGVNLNHVEGRPAPTIEPYFWHKEDRASPTSGGAPRLSILFEDGALDLRPDEWSTSWRQVGGPDEQGEKGNWDVRGGSCVFRYDVEYAQARACFAGEPVVDVILVTDANWQPDKASGYKNWIDRIQYDGFEFSHASDNNNSQAGTE